MRQYLILALLLVLGLAACTTTTDNTTPTDMPEGMDETDLDPDLHGNSVMDNTDAFGEPGPYEVVTQELPYYGEAVGFEARPADGQNYPGVVMIHEWWGLNENIKSMAELLASHGYHVVAVDLYDGQVAMNSTQARELVSSFDAEEGIENMRSAIEYLEDEGAPTIGSLGWCFGGAQSLQLAQNADLDATVIYYGNVDTDVSGVNEPVLGLFGADDGGIPVSSVENFEQELTSMNTQNSIHIYDGADHAFANPSGDRFNEDAAADAWDKTMAFLSAELHDGTMEDDSSESEVVEITVTGENYDFFVDGETNPDIVVQEGDVVRITFESTQGFHDVVIDELNVATQQIRPTDGAVTVEFVADQAGEFEYYCSVGNHRAQGMFGNFIVE